MVRGKVKYNQNLGEIGKNIAKIRDKYGDRTSERDYFLGNLYLASCKNVNRCQSDIEQDRQLVNYLAENLKLVSELSDEELKGKISHLENDANAAESILRGLGVIQKPIIRMGSWQSLMSRTISYLNNNPNNDYSDIGRKLNLASEDLVTRLSQTNKHALEEQAILTLNKYLTPVKYK